MILLASDAIHEINRKNCSYSFFPILNNDILVGSVRLLDISESGLMG